MSKTIYIGGRLESKEKGNVVTGANAILDDTKRKKQNVINKETDDELLRLEQSKQDNLTFDNAPTEDSTNPVTSGGVYTAEKALSDAIEAILLLIPSAATALNKLVDTNTMNSSISTATATFRGTYNAVSDLGLTYQATHAQIEAALDAIGLTADNNDFAFVQIPVSDQSQDIAKTERFKFNGTNWLYEYDLNTSGFTAQQWAAINSGITVALVTKLTDLPTAAALQLALNAKQDNLTFDTTPTASSTNPVTSGGIYLAIQAVATALSNYSDTTDNRLNTLEGLIPTEASSSNKLTDKAYVDGLIQAITELIPAEATTTNQLADKAYVLASILAATPAFKGQFVTLAELQAVASPKAGDLGIVRTKDSDGMDVFTVYQYLSNAWNVFFSLSYHPQTKPATTGTTGDYPYNGMGRVELDMNMVNTGTELAPVMVNQLTQDMFYKGAVGSRVPNTNTIFVIRYDYVLAENITIPDSCVLEFEGGSISGSYTLTGANTTIANKEGFKVFFGVNLAGTFNKILPIEWFATPDADITTIINNLFEVTDVVTISNNYNISNTINLKGKSYKKLLGLTQFPQIRTTSVHVMIDMSEYCAVENIKFLAEVRPYDCAMVRFHNTSTNNVIGASMKNCIVQAAATQEGMTGTSIGVQINTGYHGGGIYNLHIDNVDVDSLDVAFDFVAGGDATDTNGICWINDNKITNCRAYICQTAVRIKSRGDSGTMITGNEIQVTYENAGYRTWYTNNVYDIEQNSDIYNNVFSGEIWDTPIASSRGVGHLGCNYSIPFSKMRRVSDTMVYLIGSFSAANSIAAYTTIKVSNYPNGFVEYSLYKSGSNITLLLKKTSDLVKDVINSPTFYYKKFGDIIYLYATFSGTEYVNIEYNTSFGFSFITSSPVSISELDGTFTQITTTAAKERIEDGIVYTTDGSDLTAIASMGNDAMGVCAFSYTSKKPMWWTGSKWVYADGSDV